MPQQVEQHETVDVAQPKIERNGQWLNLARNRGRPRPAVETMPFSRLRGRLEQDVGERRVVLDDQHERLLAQIVAVVVRLNHQQRRHSSGLFLRAGVPPMRGIGGRAERDIEGEVEPTPGFEVT